MYALGNYRAWKRYSGRCGYDHFAVNDMLSALFDMHVSIGRTISIGGRTGDLSVNFLFMTPWNATGDGIARRKITIPASTTSRSYRVYATGTDTIELFAKSSFMRNLTRALFAF